MFLVWSNVWKHPISDSRCGPFPSIWSRWLPNPYSVFFERARSSTFFFLGGGVMEITERMVIKEIQGSKRPGRVANTESVKSLQGWRHTRSLKPLPKGSRKNPEKLRRDWLKGKITKSKFRISFQGSADGWVRRWHYGDPKVVSESRRCKYLGSVQSRTAWTGVGHTLQESFILMEESQLIPLFEAERGGEVFPSTSGTEKHCVAPFAPKCT
jgi:hypothetical protein